MYGADFQWIIQGGLGPWWLDASDTDCSTEQLQAAARSLITVSAYTGRLPDHTSVSGLVSPALLIYKVLRNPQGHCKMRLKISSYIAGKYSVPR